nr:isocitrate/isopropylmalate dehydrogenase family protein [Thermoleophilaceae bacterium]
MAHTVTLIPGDGTGPELVEATRRVLEATGVEFEWDEHPAGVDIYEEEGSPFPERTLESIKRNKVGIKGPTTTPVGSGFRSVNVLLRKELDLYACIRPCKAYEGVRTRFPETDIVIVRENTEDLYAGIEFERGSDEVKSLQKFLAEELDLYACVRPCKLYEGVRSHFDEVDFVIVRENTEDLYAGIEFEMGTPDNATLREALKGLGAEIREDAGISIKPISVFGSDRIVEAAFQYAEDNGRKKVTAAHKANIMKFSDGLFLDVARKVAERHPDIEFEDRIIDNLCNQLVSRPEEYDVVVLPNLYGDIVSDLGAGMI